MQVCIHCSEEFDLRSPVKIRAGGKINECPDCSEEHTIKYDGVQAAGGKQATILKFESDSDRDAYLPF